MAICFAFKNSECSALNEGIVCDGCNTKCKFYKTLEQVIYERQKRNDNRITEFALIIDGRKHGDFETIEDMDNYLKRYWEYNKEEENTKIKRYHKEYADDWNSVFFNHNIVFAHRRD